MQFINPWDEQNFLAARLLLVNKVGRAQGKRWCRTFTRFCGLPDWMAIRLFAALKNNPKLSCHDWLYHEIEGHEIVINEVLGGKYVATRSDYACGDDETYTLECF